MTSTMSARTWIRVAVVATLAAGVAAVFLLDLHTLLTLEFLAGRRDMLDGWVERHFGAALAIYFLLYVLVISLSLPGAAVMTLAGGALFGLAWGIATASFASTLGATVTFLLARFLFRDAVQRRFGNRLTAVNRGMARDGAFYLLSLRLVPVVPFWLINLMMALTPIRPWTFYWVSQLGMLPATIVFVNAGTQLARIDSVRDIFSPVIMSSFLLLALLPLLLRFVLKMLAQRKAYRGYRKPNRYDYNLVVIGAGAGGLVSAYIGATVGARVALIEQHRMGGDCLNTGCVPSKALLRTARLLAEARDSRRYGIDRMPARFEFDDVMQRVREVIRRIAPHDSRQRYEAMGVDVVQGHARLVSPWEIEVDDRRLSTRAIVLATGAAPLVPDLPGLERIEYLTSDTVWDLGVLPARLLVLGGGPIGCELGQAFARLGAAVTIVEMSDRLLPREDADAGALLAAHLRDEGVRLATGHRALRVETDGDGGQLVCAHQNTEVTVPFDRLLVALGRKPRTEGFGLDTLGIPANERGAVDSDGFQRTRFPNILVCGDAAGPYQFTHVAAHQAWSAALNALLRPFWSFRTDYRVIPQVTFTGPEVARVGLNEREARQQGKAVEVTRYDLAELDRAIADSANHGFVKVLTVPGKDRILGVTIVAEHAGEMLAPYVLAMKHNLGLNRILATIHVYPTFSEAAKYVAGEWKKAHKPETTLRWSGRVFRLLRG